MTTTTKLTLGVTAAIFAAVKKSPADAISLAAELSPCTDRDGGLNILAGYPDVGFSDPDMQRRLLLSHDLKEGLGASIGNPSPERGIAWAEALLDGEARVKVLAGKRPLQRTASGSAFRSSRCFRLLMN